MTPGGPSGGSPGLQVQLDEATKEELRPPCEIKYNSGRCGQPAEWVVHCLCPKHSKKGAKALLCGDHMRYAVAAADFWCKQCGAPTPLDIVSVVRL